MENPYEGHFVRIDRLFDGNWRVQFVTPENEIITGERPSLFQSREAAMSAAITLSKWFSVEIQEVK